MPGPLHEDVTAFMNFTYLLTLTYTLGEDPAHPLGKSIVMGGDGMSSFYRVKNGRIQQINRKTPRMAFTINIEESVKNPEGKFLTGKYSVYYFNQDGSIKDVESYTDRYTRVAESDLPEYRRIIGVKEGKVSVSAISISHHKML